MQDLSPGSSDTGQGQKEAEIKLLYAILESASQGILTIDQRGVIRSANRRAGELFGYAPHQLIGQRVELLLPESLREKHVGHRGHYFSALRVRPMGVGIDLLARRSDGSEFPVEIGLSYIESETGPLSIAFVSDIAERKRLQDQLVQSQKMEAVRRLAGGIAHDFNNLLTVIQGYDQFLLKKLSPESPLRGYAEEILRAAERAHALTRQLLTFSRRQIIQPVVMNINSLLDRSEKMLHGLIREPVKLVFSRHPELDDIEADVTQIERIILNLVINARDAMPDGGRIYVETGNVQLDEEYARTHIGVQPGPHVMLAVSDTGAGMDAEDKRHIFEPFFTTKSTDHGAGLGLSTVYGIVKQMKGDIWVYSEVGQGTTFKVYFPSVQAESKNEPEHRHLETAEHATILLVEDDPAVRGLIRTMLAQEGYNVLEAEDGLEAIQVSGTHPDKIHLLLTDLVMPHCTGRELAERITETRAIKVLYMSGYPGNTIMHDGVVESDLDLLPKPFTFESLLTKIREVLGKM